MSILAIPGLRRTGREAVVVAKHAGQTPTQLKQRIAELTEETGVLAADCSTFADDLVRDIIRGCQDAIALAAERDENQALKARVKELGDKVIRAEADKARLRQAVKDARPRITEVTQRLDRPYVSHVQIPYPVPVGRDMSADDTQEIPLIDQPEPWPVYAMRDQEASP